MSMVITACCKTCGCPLTLDCDERLTSGKLWLSLECENGCGAPVLQVGVPLDEFQPLR